MINRIRINRIFESTIVVMIVLTTSFAMAQEESAENTPSVASHIPAAINDATPISVIDRIDIELSGMRNVEELLLERMGYNNFGLYRPFVLGIGRVAILVNGRPGSYALGSIPISAVERIEIFSDSAVALYGGYAIGGSVNIVLRSDYEGAEFQGSATRPKREGGDSEHGSALWGGTFGSGHVTMGVDAFRRQEIRDIDRDYSRAFWRQGGSFADVANVSVGGNTVFIRGAEGSVARPLGDCKGSAYTGVLSNPYNLSGTGCGFAYADISWHRQRFERDSFYFNLDHPLDDDASLYTDVHIAQGETAFRYAPSVGTFIFTPSETLKEKLLQDPGIESIPEILNAAHRFVRHGNRDWRWDFEEYDLTLGLRGRFTESIGYDTHFQSYRYNAVESGATFVSESAIRSAIIEGRYNIENPLSTDPTHLSTVQETGLRLTRDYVTDYKTARATLNGTAFSLGGGDSRWTMGAEIANLDWRDVYDYRDADYRSYDANDVLGSAGNSASGMRRSWSAFAGVSVPLHNDSGLHLAGRRDDHDDVGATFSHKIASWLRLTHNLTLRASWSEGSRAPSLRALHQLETLDYPRVCDTSSFVGPRADCREYQVPRASVGNSDLKPDEAESISYGASVNLGNFSFDLEQFQIKISDLPRELPAQSIVDLETKGELPPGAEVLRDVDLITRIESPLYNSGESDVSGLGLRMRSGWETDLADLILDTRWSHVTRLESRVAGVKNPGDYPRDRAHISLRATHGDVSAKWSVYGRSGYRNVSRTAKYKAWIGHDVTLRWSDPSGVKGLSLSGGVLNIGDRGPSTDPTVPGLSGANVTLDSSMGRTVFLAVKYLFGS